MSSLIYSVSGGADWGVLAKPWWTIGPPIGIAYMMFVTLTIFGLLNVLGHTSMKAMVGPSE